MNKTKTIGILGGGQLARMSAFEAYKLGFRIAILEKKKNSPAGMMTHNEFVGWVDNKKIFQRFIDHSDLVTLENEFIDTQFLKQIEDSGKKVFPSSKTISLIQDKLIQKKTLRKNSIPVPEFIEVKSKKDFDKISKSLGSKFLLKSRKMGYDGYGNATVNSEPEFIKGYERLTERHSSIMAEKFVDFQKELAVMVVRTKKEIKIYPVVETIQKNHICHTVLAPAKVDPKIIEEVKAIAVEAVKAVKGIGIFGIEFFLDSGNQILVNEMAPRPHNTGHYTIEACATSQFENHIRAVAEFPLGSTEMIKPAAVMINMLGKKKQKSLSSNQKEALKNAGLHFHFYGKGESRIGRKLGHLTMVGDNQKEIFNKLKSVEEKIFL